MAEAARVDVAELLDDATGQPGHRIGIVPAPGALHIGAAYDQPQCPGAACGQLVDDADGTTGRRPPEGEAIREFGNRVGEPGEGAEGGSA